MPRYLSDLPIGICGRCSMKRLLTQLIPDGNSPGLRVCAPEVLQGCWDTLDPYRLPARVTEKINLQNPRPDTPLDSIATDETMTEILVTEFRDG